MYKLSLIVALMAMVSFSYSQDSSAAIKSKQFAIIYLPTFLNANDCQMYYDDGTMEDLTETIPLTSLKHIFQANKAAIIVRDSEFKILKYMYDKGFELLSINHSGGGSVDQYYFKHK